MRAGLREAADLLRQLGIKQAVCHRLIDKLGAGTEAAIRKDPYKALRIAGGDFRSPHLTAR